VAPTCGNAARRATGPAAVVLAQFQTPFTAIRFRAARAASSRSRLSGRRSWRR
jgi:hypothetical protein